MAGCLLKLLISSVNKMHNILDKCNKPVGPWQNCAIGSKDTELLLNRCSLLVEALWADAFY